MTLRVALVHYTCPPVIGGVESLIRTHASLLAARGYNVEVFAGRGRRFDPRVPVHLHAELDSKHPTLVDVADELRRGEVSATFMAARDRLTRWWTRATDDFDVAIVHNALTLHFNLPLTAALHDVAGHRRLRLVAWCHDLSWDNPLYVPFMRDAYPWSLLKTCHPAIRYVVISQDRQRALASLAAVDASALPVVPAGLDHARWFGFGTRTKRLLERLHLAADELVLLLPVRITRRKNIELAIRVAAALRDRGERVRLLVTGPPGPHDVRAGTYLDELLRLRTQLQLDQQVELLYPDRLSDRMVADLYHVADILFLPSAGEGFGIPLLEAGLSRLPIFCSDLPVFREIAGDWASYFAVDADPAELAERLIQFRARSATMALRQRVRRDFTWDGILGGQILPLIDPSARTATSRRE
jgi:glycosyltransferase involved in cell wall biosynthesis